MAVATRYLLPHERWLVGRLVQRGRVKLGLDVSSAERKYGAEGLRLDLAAFVDFRFGLVTGVAGGILLAVVPVVFAGLVTAYCVMGIGFASLVLSGIRQVQSSRAHREYQRTSPPFVGD